MTATWLTVGSLLIATKRAVKEQLFTYNRNDLVVHLMFWSPALRRLFQTSFEIIHTELPIAEMFCHLHYITMWCTPAGLTEHTAIFRTESWFSIIPLCKVAGLNITQCSDKLHDRFELRTKACAVSGFTEHTSWAETAVAGVQFSACLPHS